MDSTMVFHLFRTAKTAAATYRLLLNYTTTILYKPQLMAIAQNNRITIVVDANDEAATGNGFLVVPDRHHQDCIVVVLDMEVGGRLTVRRRLRSLKIV